MTLNSRNRTGIVFSFFGICWFFGLLPDGSAEPAALGRFSIAEGGHELFLPYSSNYPIDVRNTNIERIFISQHGRGGGADTYRDRGVAAASRVPGATEKTLVFAPEFMDEGEFTAPEPGNDLLYWTGGNQDWPWGGLSGDTGDHPRDFRISSFTVLDRILETVCDRSLFPNLKKILIAGHSAGGQFVNRYSATNRFEDEVAQPMGVKVRYVVMNPSSCLYFNNVRAVSGTVDDFEVPTDAAGTGFSDWGYGLENLWDYAADIGAEEIVRKYPRRDVVYLNGSLDNDPNDASLDRSDAAMYQGNNRLERGITYFNYLRHFFGPRILETQIQETVPGAAHSGNQMMRSDIGVIYLFDYNPAGSKVMYVDKRAPFGGSGTDWGDPFRSLDDAISVGRPGDEIRVAQGAYVPSIRTDPDDPRTASFALRPAVKLRGSYAGMGAPLPNAQDPVLYETRLRGDRFGNDTLANGTAENCYHVLSSQRADEKTEVRYFTIMAGNADSATSPFDAGGGAFLAGTRPQFYFCTFKENWARHGGAAYNHDGAHVSYVGCTFSHNKTFEGDGGAMVNEDSDPFLEDCLFEENHAADDAGAVKNIEGSQPRFQECDFLHNSAGDNGGAVYSYSQTFPDFHACRFLGNSSGDRGGACFHQESGNAAYVNCLFSGNFCNANGGALYTKTSRPTVQHCTLYQNSGYHGGGLYTEDTSTPQVTNSIFWSNYGTATGFDEAGQIDGDAPPTIQYCLVQGWTGTLGGEGNFGLPPNLDPWFVDPAGPDLRIGTLDDNLNLRPGSTCIDAGKELLFVTVDYEGDPRGYDGTSIVRGDGSDYDIGFDEYVTPPTPTPTPTLTPHPIERTPIPLVNIEEDYRIDAKDLLGVCRWIKDGTYNNEALLDFARFWMQDAVY